MCIIDIYVPSVRYPESNTYTNPCRNEFPSARKIIFASFLSTLMMYAPET